MTKDYSSIATVVTVGNGQKTHAFSGDSILLDVLLRNVSLSRRKMDVRVRHNGRLGKPEKDPESALVRDGDLVFLVPPVVGG